MSELETLRMVVHRVLGRQEALREAAVAAGKADAVECNARRDLRDAIDDLDKRIGGKQLVRVDGKMYRFVRETSELIELTEDMILQ